MSEPPARGGLGRARALAAVVATLALLATLGGPLISALPFGTPAELCCRRGRCCCAPQTPVETCVRAACGCGRSEAVPPPATLRPGLPVAGYTAPGPLPAGLQTTADVSTPTDVLRRPPLPPPRHTLAPAAGA